MEGVKKEKKYQSDTDWALTWRPLTQVSLLNSLPLKCLRVAWKKRRWVSTCPPGGEVPITTDRSRWKPARAKSSDPGVNAECFLSHWRQKTDFRGCNRQADFACWSFGLFTDLSAGWYKNYHTDFHETWIIRDASQSRTDPINFWCGSRCQIWCFSTCFVHFSGNNAWISRWPGTKEDF